MKKVILTLCTVLLLAIIPKTTFAGDSITQSEIEYLPDGSYYETILEDGENLNSRYNFIKLFKVSKTSTKSKTTYYRSRTGKILWYVKVTGTFKYCNGSSKCTSAYVSASSKSQEWKIIYKSSSYSGNKAIATATGSHFSNGQSTLKRTKTVVLKCSATGKFS